MLLERFKKAIYTDLFLYFSSIWIVDSFEVLSTKDQPLTASNTAASTTTIKEDENNSSSSNQNNDDAIMSGVDINEITRERDMLLEQVELLKEEHQFSMQVHQQAAATESSTPASVNAGGAVVESDVQANHRKLLKEKDNLFQENERLLRELDILREAVVAQENQSSGNFIELQLHIRVYQSRVYFPKSSLFSKVVNIF